MKIEPKYKHDCTECKFVGRFDGYDCYIHSYKQEHYGLEHTLIKRFGDDGPEYSAIPEILARRDSDSDWMILLRMGDWNAS